MPIITMQRRLREVGRIRLGEQVSAGVYQSGPRKGQPKSKPVKLTTFRLTSRDRGIIEVAAQRYGGEVREWSAPDGTQWEVITNAAEMPVVVPPGDMAFSQWYELWSAGGCRRRCDGVNDVFNDTGCSCDPDNRECNTTTRLNVMLPEVPGFGLWRLESHGYYAAVELAGVVEMCRRASSAGHMLPARLRLEQRQVKRFGSNGKPQTQNFAVPALDLDVSVGQLGQLLAGSSTPVAELANDDAALPVASGWSPVPVAELPEAPTQSVAEQLDVPREVRRRSNAAAPLPATGLRPRTAVEAAAGEIVETVERKVAMRRVLDACGGNTDRARAVWPFGDLSAVDAGELAAFLDNLDDDPDPDGPGKTSASAEGEQTTKEASGASSVVAEVVDGSPAPDEGALGSPTAGEGDEASTATLAEEPAPAEGDIDAATRRRLFALVTECCPAAGNLSSEANDEVRKRWLLRLVQALDSTAVPLESRSLISERSARKAVLACEEITEGRATYEDFVEGRVRVHVRANGGLTVQRKRNNNSKEAA